MNHSTRTLSVSIVIVLATTLAQSPLLAQTLSPQGRINAWIDSVLQHDPAKFLLSHKTLTYHELLRVQAAQALGIPFSALSVVDSTFYGSPEGQDTASVRNMSNGAGAIQNDPCVVINRKNPNILVVGVNDSRKSSDGMAALYSLDTGHTWHTTFVPTVINTQALGDPAMAHDLEGTMFYGYLRAEVGLQHDNILVAQSTDGINWTNGTPVIPADSLSGFEDKESICTDRSIGSHHYGRIYAVWTHYNDDAVTGAIKIAWSDDRCKTWSLPQIIDTVTGRFPQLAIGSHGEVLVSASTELDSVSGIHSLYTSYDGGAHFFKHFIADYTQYPRNVEGYPALKGSNGFRCYPYMSFDVSFFNDVIYLVYGDWYNNSAAVQYFVSSTNLGVTWSAPYAIGYQGKYPTPATARDRFCPSVTVNQFTGEAVASYYSSERDSMNILVSPFKVDLDPWGISTSVPLLPADFDPFSIHTTPGKPPYLGDYVSADSYSPVYTTAWTEPDSNSTYGSVFGYFDLQKAASSVAAVVASGGLMISSMSPNPFQSGVLHVSITSDRTGTGSMSLYDINGSSLGELWHGNVSKGSSSVDLSVPRLAAGTYIVRFSEGESSVQTKLVITN